MRRGLAISALVVVAVACAGPDGSGSTGRAGEPTGPDATRVQIYAAAFRSLAETEGWFDPVLLDERDAVERRALDGHVKVVAAARPVEHGDRPTREGLLEQRADRVDRHPR